MAWVLGGSGLGLRGLGIIVLEVRVADAPEDLQSQNIKPSTKPQNSKPAP